MMFRRFSSLVLGLVLALAPWLAAADSVPEAKTKDKEQRTQDEVQDFVFLGDRRPVLVRLHIQIDEKALHAAWNAFMKELFESLDTNHDGVLSQEEAEKAPPPQALFNTTGYPGTSGPPTLRELDIEPTDGKVTLQELANYYRRHGGGPFHVRVGSSPTSGPIVIGNQAPAPTATDLNQVLFGLLDTNQDGKLSRRELAAATDVLRELDLDEDEMITVSELVPRPELGPGALAIADTPAGVSGADHPAFVLLTPGEPPTHLARRLLSHYGPKSGGESKLTVQEIGLEQADFDALDRNQDGVLDLDELAHFPERHPDLEVMVGLGKGAGVDLVRMEGQPTALATSAQKKEGGVSLDVGITRLEIRGSAGEPAFVRGVNIARQVYTAQFQAADKDNNGYLDRQEAEQSPFFRSTFALMDRDGDGKVFEKEMFAYLDQIQAWQNKVKACCATLTIADQGQGLFDLIDTNRDGRLSVRELRNAVNLVDQLDRNRDGQIDQGEIPRQYQLTLALGAPSSNQFPGAVVVLARNAKAPPAKPASVAGPVWFRKMDRNRDGDVSRREFLGTDEEFRRLDTDGDGLISLEEAERADAALRKAKPKEH